MPVFAGNRSIFGLKSSATTREPARPVAIGVANGATAGGPHPLPRTQRRTAGWIVARQVAIGVANVATNHIATRVSTDFRRKRISAEFRSCLAPTALRRRTVGTESCHGYHGNMRRISAETALPRCDGGYATSHISVTLPFSTRRPVDRHQTGDRRGERGHRQPWDLAAMPTDARRCRRHSDPGRLV